MKILITGSAGFIGGHLLKALQRQGKHQLLGVDKKLGVDISDGAKLKEVVNKLLGKPDIIVHFAAQTLAGVSIENPSLDFRDNVVGTFNICELARETGAKVIYSSSRKVKPNEISKRSPYGLSKFIGELYLKEYAALYGVKVIIDRFGNIYGPGQVGAESGFWLAWFIRASLENKPITIFGWRGKQSRCMLYIDDLVELLLDQIENFEKYEGGPYEIGGGPRNEISIIETLDNILKYKNYKFAPRRYGDRKREVFDNKKIYQITDWRPKMPIKGGIQKTIEWFRSSYEI